MPLVEISVQPDAIQELKLQYDQSAFGSTLPSADSMMILPLAAAGENPSEFVQQADDDQISAAPTDLILPGGRSEVYGEFDAGRAFGGGLIGMGQQSQALMDQSGTVFAGAAVPAPVPAPAPAPKKTNTGLAVAAGVGLLALAIFLVNKK
jgi:hypothetical protein